MGCGGFARRNIFLSVYYENNKEFFEFNEETNTYTLVKDHTIPCVIRVIMIEDEKLIIAEGITLTVNGGITATPTVNFTRINNNGTLNVGNEGELYFMAVIEGLGEAIRNTSATTVNNKGTIEIVNVIDDSTGINNNAPGVFNNEGIVKINTITRAVGIGNGGIFNHTKGRIIFGPIGHTELSPEKDRGFTNGIENVGEFNVSAQIEFNGPITHIRSSEVIPKRISGIFTDNIFNINQGGSIIFNGDVTAFSNPILSQITGIELFSNFKTLTVNSSNGVVFNGTFRADDLGQIYGIHNNSFVNETKMELNASSSVVFNNVFEVASSSGLIGGIFLVGITNFIFNYESSIVLNNDASIVFDNTVKKWKLGTIDILKMYFNAKNSLVNNNLAKLQLNDTSHIDFISSSDDDSHVRLALETEDDKGKVGKIEVNVSENSQIKEIGDGLIGEGIYITDPTPVSPSELYDAYYTINNNGIINMQKDSSAPKWTPYEPELTVTNSPYKGAGDYL